MIGKGIYKGVFKRWQIIALSAFVFIACFHAFIANDKYLIAGSDSGITFFEEKQDAQWGLLALIPYSDSYMDRNNRSVGPFDKQEVSSIYYRHWLGTDSLGRDVLAGLIYGSYIALQVGLFSVALSLLIGIVFSFLGGYFGDGGLRIDRYKLLGVSLISLFGIFYALNLGCGIGVLIILLLIFLWILSIRYSSRKTKATIGLPMDMIILKIIELINSIPGLFLILVLLSMFAKPSIWNVVLVIVLLRWPVVTRHLRAEILKIKEEDYIMSARSIGLPDWKIYLNHILPMCLSPIIIVSAFGFASAILLESTLSFLGIGVALDQQTWGSIIKNARFDISAWWLALFPGVCIYIIVVLFNSIGDDLNKIFRTD